MNNMIQNKGSRRQKRTEIKQIVNLNKRHVTFSKRRAGVFKKASELCVLTGAECAVICESFGKRVFAFGHPSVESIVDKYLGKDHKSSSESPEINDSETHDVNSPCMHDKLKKEYLEINKEIEIEKNKSVNENSNNTADMDEKSDLFWWEQPFDHLEVEELEQYISSMEQLMNNIKFRADDLMLIRSSSSSMFDANKTLNDENKNLVVAKDDGLPPDELLVNKKLTFSELLAIKSPDFNDDGLDAFLLDLEHGNNNNNNVQVPNAYGNFGNEVQLSRNIDGNLVVPKIDDGTKAVVDLHDFDSDDFSLFYPPN